jgi:hypothetical protein
MKEKTYFGSVVAERTTGKEKSTNIYMDKESAVNLAKQILNMVTTTKDDEKLCLFVNRQNNRVTVTREFKKDK